MRFLLLMLMPIFATAQQGWVSITIQGDEYGSETTWLVRDSSDAIVAGSAPLQGEYPYVEAFLPLPIGDYTFSIYDTFGDGICCGFGEGWFSVNTCVLDTTVYDFSTSEQTIPFEVLACPPPIFGCMQAGAINYHPWANAPAPCEFPPIQCEEGYNNILVTVTPDTYAAEISWDLITVPDGEVVAEGSGYSIVGAPVVEAVCLPIGSDFVVNVYDSFGDGMCGSCYGGVDGNLLVSNLCGEMMYYVGDTTQYEVVSSDTIMIDPCFPPVPQGCTDSWFTEYDPIAVIDDGSCQTEVILGCTDPEAINFNEDANTLETEDNCDFTLTLTDGAGDGWFGSWVGVQQGDEIWGPLTMYPNDGFEKEIQIPLYSGEGVRVMFFTQGNAETTASQCGFYFDGPTGVFMEGGTNPWSDAIKKFPFKYDGIPECEDFCEAGIVGCTLSFACDYNPDANVDGDCTFPIEYYGCNNECINDADGDGVCDELEVAGCQDPTAYNYNESATDPASCEEVVFGCTDPTMFNFNEEANTENNSCIEFIYGCTIPTAINYNPLANTDNGSCVSPIPGCMDLDAANYNVFANTPANEECLYDAGCITGPGNPYWANDYCYSWVIEVDPYCCEVGWDAVCIDMHEYCGQGVTNVEDMGYTRVQLWPNPTRDIINFQAPIGAFADVYSTSGRVVVSSAASGQIDLRSLPNGVYEIVINYKGRIKVERVIKQ